MNRRQAFINLGGCILSAALCRKEVFSSLNESDIFLHTKTGTLAGTLTISSLNHSNKLALIIAGSGPTDRNGNNPFLPGRNNVYRLLAAELAMRSISSVRYDKRGVGASAMLGVSDKDLRFEANVRDIIQWMRLLQKDNRFQKIVIVGHSEGSLAGMLAAQQAQPDAFVSLEGAGEPASKILRYQIKRNVSANQYIIGDKVISALEAGKPYKLPSSASLYLQSLLRDSVQPYEISWFKYDPAIEISKLNVPKTIVQGTADVQVNVLNAELLKRADPSASLVLIAGMNHMLRYAPDTSSMNAIAEGYLNASLPIHPGVIQHDQPFVQYKRVVT